MTRSGYLEVVLSAMLALALAAGCGRQQQPGEQQGTTPAGGEEQVAVKGAFDDYDGDASTAPAPKTPEEAEAARKAYSPFAGRTYPTRPYFGETHNHTANSGDAYMAGNTLSPEQAFRFARGEEVVSSTGIPVKLSRPLDFLVVADHAEA